MEYGQYFPPVIWLEYKRRRWVYNPSREASMTTEFLLLVNFSEDRD